MEVKSHKLKLKYGDFEFELEGDKDFVDRKSSDIPTIISMLVQRAPVQTPSIQPQQLRENNTTDINSERTSRPLSIGEFLNNKKFSTGSDLTLGVGYYLENHCSYNSITSNDIKEYCRKGKLQPPKNVSDCLTANVKKGLLMPLDDKKDGSICYQLTNPGTSYIEGYTGTDKKPTKSKRVKSKESNNEFPVLKISVDDLNLNSYVDIQKLTRTEDQALMIIKIYSAETEFENLSTEEITLILRTKFAIPINEQQVATALRRSKPKVEGSKIDGKLKYRLMKPGETYLQELKQNIELES